MANRTTHRRILAAPEPKPSMDPPTLKKPTKLSTSQHLSNNLAHPTTPSKPSSISNNTTSSRVNTSHRVCTSNSQQAKAMSVSAIMDSSKPRLKLVGPYTEIQSKATKELAFRGKPTKDLAFKDKPTKELAFEDKSDKPNKDLDTKKRVEENLVVKKMKKKEKEMVGFLKEHDFDSRRLSVSLNSSGGGGGGRRRRSLCGSQVQFSDVFASNGVKIVSADMPPFMQIHAVECARRTHGSLEKFTSKTLALTLKKEFDGVYGPAWHCIVGTSFGSFVTHSVSGFLYFSMDQKLYMLLFKTTVQRAD